MTSVVAPIAGREYTSPGGSVKSLIAVVMLVATILCVLFDAAALITVWKGPVQYQGADATTSRGRIVVADVTDSNLYRRGVRPGQTVSWSGRSEWRASYPRAGDTIQIQTPSGTVSVVAARQPFTPALLAVSTVAILGAIGVLIFAGILCYRKPGIMTVSLWLFVAANFNIQWLMDFYAQVPEPFGRVATVLILAIAGGWSYYPIVWFALRFPDDRITNKGLRIADYCWTAISLTALVWFLFDASRVTFPGASAGVPFENMAWRYTIPQNIPCPAAIAAFLWVFVRSGEQTKQRVLWAIVGFLLMIVFETIGNFASELISELYLAGNVAFMLAVFCPLALVYGIFRHHLLDISFVVNRALVYSALTTIIVFVVGFVDWLAGKYLFETRAALAVEATVIIALGYLLQRVHGVLERAVDRVIFASRHLAERHIERVIAGLAFARTPKSVLQAIVDEPRAALDLVSCAAFIGDGESLALRSHYGWSPGSTTAMEQDDPLARLLLAERRTLDIAQAHWHSSVTGLSAASLDIAVPLFSRNDLLGVVLFGRHRNGSAIDPEERKLLERLCSAAAVAYEAIELAQAREELNSIRNHLLAQT